jgi:hypothetical protein
MVTRILDIDLDKSEDFAQVTRPEMGAPNEWAHGAPA